MRQKNFETNNRKGKVDLVDQHVGKRLKLRRLMLGISRQEMSEAVNVSVQQIQKYEKATNRISSGKLFALAKLLYVPVEFFFKDVDKNVDYTFETKDNKDSYSNIIAIQDAKEEYDSLDTSLDKDLERLSQSFCSIKNRSIRTKILDLVKSLSTT